MIEAQAVAAVVDAEDGKAFIWWTAIGLPVAGFGRLCGAWVLDRDDDRVAGLVTGRYVVATHGGHALVQERGIGEGVQLNLDGTLLAVREEVARLQTIFERENDARIASKKLKAPSWPVLPAGLDIERPHTAPSDSTTGEVGNRALDIAHWINALCACWDEVEDQRMARPWMSALDGSDRRLLPAVLG